MTDRIVHDKLRRQSIISNSNCTIACRIRVPLSGIAVPNAIPEAVEESLDRRAAAEVPLGQRLQGLEQGDGFLPRKQ